MMTNAVTYARDRIAVDRHAVALAGLLLVVQAGAVWLAQGLARVGYEPDTPVGGPDASAAESAGVGAAWVGAEIGIAVGLLAVVLLYRRLPEWLQDHVRRMLGVTAALAVGGYWADAGILAEGIVLAVALATVYEVADQLGIWWVLNDIAAVALAILTGAIIAHVLGVWGLLVGLVGLTAYDHLFANKRAWMFDIADLLLKMRLPIIVYWPPTWRYQWSRLWEDDEGVGDDPDELQDDAWGIGMADLALPAAFASAVAVAPAGGLVSGGTLAALGVVAGGTLAAFRLRYELLTQGSGAGMPAISAGAIGGFAVMQVGLAVAVLAGGGGL